MNSVILFGQKRARHKLTAELLPPMKDAGPECRHEPLDGRLLTANRSECPMCGSKNTEEDDGGMKCVDCGTHFKKVNMQEVFARLLKSQKKTLDFLANHTEKQVDD